MGRFKKINFINPIFLDFVKLIPSNALFILNNKQKEAVINTEGPMLILAGAGSGKTHRLTETLTELIKTKKVKPEEVILTTFTTKAANEFKEKAKAFLFDEGMYEEAMQLDHAMIGTVHSVCQRMIGKYWFYLGLSPNMGVMAEEDTKYYISQSAFLRSFSPLPPCFAGPSDRSRRYPELFRLRLR